MARRAHLVALVLWLGVAALLRFFWLHRWSLWGDESHTLSDVLALDAGEWKDSVQFYPLFYWLEWASLRLIGGAWGPEFALRCVPALAGTLAIGVFFHCSRGILTRRERHLGTLVLALSPWLLFHSQFARFYSLLLMFSTAMVFCFLHAMQRDSRRQMVWAIVWFLLAASTHPSVIPVFVGLVIGAVLERLRSGRLRRGVMGRPLLVLLAIAAVAAAFLRESILRTVGFVVTSADAAAGGVVDLAQGVVYNFGLAPSMLTAGGAWFLWRRRRACAAFVFVGVGVPLTLLCVLVWRGVLVEQRYLIPCLPLLLVPVSMALGELARRLRGAVPVPTLVVGSAVILPFLPSVVSHYLDGNRHDLRSLAEALSDRVGPDDLIVSEYHSLMEFYLPALDARRILEAPPRWEDDTDGMSLYWQMTRDMRTSGRGVVWGVVPSHFENQPGDRRAFLRWLQSTGRLELETGATRLDYHQNVLFLFRVAVDDPRRWRPERPRD